jgi:CO/xanthine dehydrogenase FAD-binding subunit
MKPSSFEYIVPTSIEEALEAIRQSGADAKYLAGGQSLVPAMNFRIAQPAVLVDLNRIPELRYIHADADGLRIGAMTRQRRLEADGGVARQAPLLAEAVPYIAHPQIRNRGTIGGSLVHADPASELPVIAVALEAVLRVRSTAGERRIPASEFFLGMFTTALQPEELLVEIEIPPVPAGAGHAFVEFSRRRGDYALMGVAARVQKAPDGTCRAARIVLLNAADGPVTAAGAAEILIGRSLDERTAEDAAVFTAEKEIEPMGNLHATPDFQRHLARVLVRRAVLTAASRAG